MVSKKQGSKPRVQTPAQQATLRDRKVQRDALKTLKLELEELHELSLFTMYDMGVLPPLYAGEHLGDDREAIALWRADEDKPEIGAMFLRVMPNVEPNAELQEERKELGLFNDWAVVDLLKGLVDDNGKPMIEGAEALKGMNIMFALLGNQIYPASGYDHDKMIEAVSELQPYAVFIHIPVSGDGDEMTYRWDDLEHYRAEVIYAPTPMLLEVAVWEYRLNLALTTEHANLLEAEVDPDEEMLAFDAAELGALWDMMVMRTIRVYGTTSAIRARQLELDVIREENGDLVIMTPLKPEIEPVEMLAEARTMLQGDRDNVLIRIDAGSEMMKQIWPQVRANDYFAIRIRQGQLTTTKTGKVRVNGFSEALIMEWLMAESLDDIFQQARLFSLYELLAATDFIVGSPPQAMYEATLNGSISVL